ncbi:hypothetical protein AAMO2058_000764000 [Amorphochlora amoebiformis]
MSVPNKDEGAPPKMPIQTCRVSTKAWNRPRGVAKADKPISRTEFRRPKTPPAPLEAPHREPSPPEVKRVVEKGEFRKMIHQMPFLVRQLEAGLYVAKRTSAYLQKIIDLNKSHVREVDAITHHETTKDEQIKRDSMSHLVTSFISIRQELVQRARDQAVFYHEIEQQVTKPVGEWHKGATTKLNALKKAYKHYLESKTQEVTLRKKMVKEQELVAKLWHSAEEVSRGDSKKKHQKAIEKFDTATVKYHDMETKYVQFVEETERTIEVIADKLEDLETERLQVLSKAFSTYNSLLEKLSIKLNTMTSHLSILANNIEPKQALTAAVQNWVRVYGVYKRPNVRLQLSRKGHGPQMWRKSKTSTTDASDSRLSVHSSIDLTAISPTKGHSRLSWGNMQFDSNKMAEPGHVVLRIVYAGGEVGTLSDRDQKEDIGTSQSLDPEFPTPFFTSGRQSMAYTLPSPLKKHKIVPLELCVRARILKMPPLGARPRPLTEEEKKKRNTARMQKTLLTGLHSMGFLTMGQSTVTDLESYDGISEQLPSSETKGEKSAGDDNYMDKIEDEAILDQGGSPGKWAVFTRKRKVAEGSWATYRALPEPLKPCHYAHGTPKSKRSPEHFVEIECKSHFASGSRYGRPEFVRMRGRVGLNDLKENQSVKIMLEPCGMGEKEVSAAISKGDTHGIISYVVIERIPAFYQRKRVYMIRHAESLWNKAQRDKNIVGLLSQVDHELTENGVVQALRLSEKLKAACESSRIDRATKGFLNAEMIFCSPLARAVQTALVGLRNHPLFQTDQKRESGNQGTDLEGEEESKPEDSESDTSTSPTSSMQINQGPRMILLPATREKKNTSGSRDTVATVRGPEIIQSALRRLPGSRSSQTAGGSHMEKDVWSEVQRMSRLVDTSHATDQWWNENPDDESSMRERLDDLMSVLQFSPFKKIIVVGHSHFFREFFNMYLSDSFRSTYPQIYSDLTNDVLKNCADGKGKGFNGLDAWKPTVKDVQLLFGSRFAGKKHKHKSVLKKSKQANFSHWVRDEDVSQCQRCNAVFSIGLRKHHCRECGGIYCNECSSHRIPVRDKGFANPVRVCDSCYGKLTGCTLK